jgi:hypothetical protein
VLNDSNFGTFGKLASRVSEAILVEEKKKEQSATEGRAH